MLPLKCQRCLEVLEWAVAYDFKLGIVSSFAQADGLPEGFEPLMLPEDGKVSVKDIVEDEILIILPDIPKHAADCVVAPSPGNNKPINTKQLQQVVTHPFSILADFKKLETLNGSTKK